MKVEEEVNPIHINAILAGVNFIFSFLTSFLVPLASVVSTLGNGKNAINKPSIAIATAATINIVLNGNALEEQILYQMVMQIVL